MAAYGLLGVVLGLWGIVTVKKRLGRFPSSKKDIDLLVSRATSPWDPFNPLGGKRWRFILFTLFSVLVVLNFATR
jgi:hypothetical protein